MQTLRVLQSIFSPLLHVLSPLPLRLCHIKLQQNLSPPPTPGSALQQKIESKLEQSLESRLDIQLEQKMGIFQANMLEAMKSLREDFQKSMQKTSSQVEMDQISAFGL